MPSNRLDIFQAHGVSWSGESGDQLIGYCPFSNREDKFYVNRKTLLWDSKTAGISGNVHDFLKHTANRYYLALTDNLRQKLAADRQLPVEAFAELKVGWTGQAFSIPIQDVNGRTVDIRMYRPGHRIISTKGAHTGLFRAELLSQYRDRDVYLCEGEWDTIALTWLHRKLMISSVVVGVPGADTFKPDWILWLSGRNVHTLYDKDGPGEMAEHRVLKALRGRVQRLTFVHWPDALPDGFDVRDWVIEGAIKQQKPKRCWRNLVALFRDVPRQTVVDPESTSETGASAEPIRTSTADNASTTAAPYVSKWTVAPALQDVYSEFKKWLYLDTTDPIDIMLAVAVSQHIDGEPLWMFLVGPPGSAKTETLNSLSWISNTYMTSSVTPHSLISGANWSKGEDPSLIPRLNGKVMVIKDFTSILAMRDTEKDEIFGILRDAYDGRCGKEFGNGVIRNYESRFTILAAVTPSIYALSSNHTALGERFLKFGIGDNLIHRSEEQIIERAINNINQETSMRSDLADVVNGFISRRLRLAAISNGSLPALSTEYQRRVIALARFGARMRGTVTRDTYRNDIITSRPSAEVGSRLGKQLAKLCQALALIRQRRSVGPDDYRLAKKVMLDTIPQRTEDVLRTMLVACPTMNHTLTVNDIATLTRYPIATVQRLVQDMNVLDIVTRSPVNKGRSQWTLSDYIRNVIQIAGLYKTEEELTRPTRLSMRVVRRRKKRKESENA